MNPRKALVGVVVSLIGAGLLGAVTQVSADPAPADPALEAVERFVQPDTAALGEAAAVEHGLTRNMDPVVKGCELFAEVADPEGGGYCLDELMDDGMAPVEAWEIAARISGEHPTVDDLATFVENVGAEALTSR